MRIKRKQVTAAPRHVSSKRQRLTVSTADGDDEPDEPDEDGWPDELDDATAFRTRKCSLRSISSETALVLPWTQMLKDLNKAAKEAQILANLHVIRLLDAHRPIPMLNKQFYYKCLAAVSDGFGGSRRITDVDLRRSVEVYQSWRDPAVPYANGSFTYGWFQNASTMVATNAQNHIVDNYYQRFQNYIKQRFGLTRNERYELLRDVLEPTYQGQDARVLEMRRWIPRNHNGWIDERNPHLILPLLHRFLRYIEVENFRRRREPNFRQFRAFSFLPLKKGFECSHFRMCKTGLHALFRRAGIPVPPLIRPRNDGLAWSDIADELWYHLFDVRRFETQHCRFTGQIVTDGKAVSVIMRTPARPDPEISFKSAQLLRNIPNLADFEVVWGLDPGRRDLFVATNNFGDTMTCSSREFYLDAKYTSSNRTIRHWMEHNQPVLEATRNMPSAKTCSLVKLHRCVRFLIPRLDLLLDFCIAKPFRKLRFRRFVFMMRKLHAICKGLTEQWGGERTLVGFGDWSATDRRGIIKRCPPGGPAKKLKNVLKQHCTVASIPEYNTSKLHAECHRELTHQYALRMCKDGVERQVKVYRVLHCRHSGCFGMTVNRDKNASKNILHLTEYYLENGVRHPAFRR